MRPTEEVLGRARRGDHTAFAAVVREYEAMVFSLACHFLRDRGHAEELAQEVFLELYQKLPTIESPDHLKFWLRRVTSNRCIDHSRRRKVRPLVGLDDVPELAVAASDADPILARTLQRYVGTLAETPRMVVLLRYQEDLSPTEIAEVLEIPLNTVKSHLQRSLSILREKMRERLTRCVGEAV